MTRGPRLALRQAVLGGLGSLVLVTLGGYGSEGCRTPTQVTVELRTFGALPCASLKGVAIVVAHDPMAAEKRMGQRTLSAEVPRGVCAADGRSLGTLVITPQDSTGAVVVVARFNDGPDATCEPPDYKGCIVARRSFSFIEHASLTLPISLEASCVDVPCDVVSSCRAGTCVSSEAQCSESSGICDSAAQPVAASDGGSLPPDVDARDDATPIDGATNDGAPSEASPDAPSDAPPDVDPGLFGNTCPAMGGARDCAPDLCCAQSAFFCSANCGLYFKFGCLGRKYCSPGAYCCGNVAAGPKGSFCDTTAGQACTENGRHYICTGDADCPPSLPICNGVYHSTGGGTVKECTIGL